MRTGVDSFAKKGKQGFHIGIDFRS